MSTLIYSGSAWASSISGKVSGTYYYRVRWCNETGCGAYVAAPNGVVVNNLVAAPSIPASLTVPTTPTSTGAITITWTASTGTVSRYELYESTDSGFATSTKIYNNTGLTTSFTRPTPGTYYYRVRACYATGTGEACSDYRVGANGVQVIPPAAPSIPASITVPTTTTGGFTVSWTASTGTVTRYELHESTDSTFATGAPGNMYTALSWTNTKTGTGTFYYRVRACNTQPTGTSCSGWRTGANAMQVVSP
jgi:hypothetical protein